MDEHLPVEDPRRLVVDDPLEELVGLAPRGDVVEERARVHVLVALADVEATERGLAPFPVRDHRGVVADGPGRERERQRLDIGVAALDRVHEGDAVGAVALVLDPDVLDVRGRPGDDLREVVPERLRVADHVVGLDDLRLRVLPDDDEVPGLDERGLLGGHHVDDVDRAFDGDALRDVQEQAVEVERGVQGREGVHAEVGVPAEVLRQRGAVGAGRFSQTADGDGVREPAQVGQ